MTTTRRKTPARRKATVDTAGAPVPVTWHAAYYDGGPRTRGLDYIVIHSIEGPIDQAGLAVSLAAYYFGTTDCHETSANAIIDSGAIVEMVKPDVISWQCGNGNPRGYGIEQSGYARYSRAEWLDPDGRGQMRNVAWWAASIARQYNIPPRWLTDAQLATPGEKGFVTHADVTRVLGGTTHTDPGDGYPRDLLMQAIAGELAGTAPAVPPVTPPSLLEEVVGMYKDQATFEAALKKIVHDQALDVVRKENISNANGHAKEALDAIGQLPRLDAITAAIPAAVATKTASSVAQGVAQYFTANPPSSLDDVVSKVGAAVETELTDAVTQIVDSIVSLLDEEYRRVARAQFTQPDGKRLVLPDHRATSLAGIQEVLLEICTQLGVPSKPPAPVAAPRK